MPTPILATNNALVVPDDFHGSSSSADLPNSLWATPTAEVYETHVNVSPELSMFPTLKHPQNLEFFVQKNTQDLKHVEALFKARHTYSTPSVNFIFNVIAGSSSLEEFQGAALLIAKSVLPKNVRSPQGQQLDWLSCVVRNPLGIDMYSANHGLLIRLNCLHQAGCDITPVIHFAIQNKNSKFLNVVRQMDVNLETTDVEFNNVLHLVFNDYLTHQNIAQLVEQVFSYSLKNVLLLTQQNHSNQTPLDLALKPLSPEESTVFKQEFEKQLVQKAASLDKLDASRNIAHCILGTLYQTDFFTKADLVKAFHHFNLANQSNRCPQASYLLGLAYLKMEGVEQQNVALGVSLIESAANAGMAHAQLALAHIKLKGVLSPQNISQAMHWLHLAAKQGNAQARFDLACLAEKNYHANPHKPMPPALHYELAAQLGHLDAQFKIGLTHIYNFKALIAEGKSGAEPSLVRHLQQGCMWLKLAWKNGHFYAGNEWAWSKSDLEKFAPEHALANENPLYMHSPYTETIAPHLETPKPYLDQRIKTLKSGVNIVLGQLKGRYPNSLLSDYQFFETAATALGPLNQKLNRYDQCSVALRPTPKFKSIYTQNTLQQVGLFRSVGVDESKITDFEYNLSMAKEVLKLGALLRVQFQSGNAPDFDSLWCYCRAWRVSRLASFSEQEEVKSFKASRLTHSNRIRTPLHLGSERYAAILNELINKARQAVELNENQSPLTWLRRTIKDQTVNDFVLQHVIDIEGRRLKLTKLSVALNDDFLPVQKENHYDGEIRHTQHVCLQDLCLSLQKQLYQYGHTLRAELSQMLFQAELQAPDLKNPAHQRILKMLGEMHYVVAHGTFDLRGSAAKSELFIRALAVSAGLELPPYKKGYVPDLEAFLSDYEGYAANYPNVFES